MPVGLLPVFFQDYSVNQWLRGGVPASKLLIGIPMYGRTYTLVNPDDHGLGAPINDSGPAGLYTGERGFLAYYEVFQCVFLQKNSLLKVHKLTNRSYYVCMV